MRVRFKSRMPPASGNSVIIGAACYSPQDDDDLLQMRSGVTLVSEIGVGHCSFSRLLVQKEKCLRAAEYDTR